MTGSIQTARRRRRTPDMVPLRPPSQVARAVRATLASAGMGLVLAPVHSRAESECGPQAPSVSCSPADYSGGISYQNDPAGGPTDVPGLQLHLQDDVVVDTTSGQDGVAIEKSGAIGLTTGQNVSITVGVTGTGDRDGIRLDSINGTVTIDSHADVDVDNVEGDGIIARSNSADNEAPTFPTGKSHGSGNVSVISSGTIHVRGNRSTGISAGSSGLTTSVTVTGNITTEGASESGAVLVQNNREPNNQGVARATVTGAHLSTMGSESAAIGVAAERGSAVVNIVRDAVLGGSISTQGANSMGIGVATGLTELYTIDSSIASVGTKLGTGAIVNNGTAASAANDGVGITTQGDWAFGIGALSKGGAVTILNRGDIATHGDVATGIAVLSSYVRLFGAAGDPITINNTASIVTGDSADSTVGGSAAGIAALAFSADINVASSGAITTYGDTISVPAFEGIGLIARSAGIQAVVTRTVGIPLGGIGAVRVSTTATGTIHTEGAGAKGINVQTHSGLAQVVADGQITTLGDDADGVDALSLSGAINLTTADIATEGTNAFGIRAANSSGAVTVSSQGTIATRGAQARGIHTQTTTGAIAITTAAVSTEGDDADSVRGVTTSGVLTATVGDISTGAVSTDGLSLLGGTNSNGLYLSRSAATAGAVVADTTAGTITTRGNDASGIHAINGGDAVTVATGDVSTGVVSGDSMTLLGGTSSHGVEAHTSGSTAAAIVTIDTTAGTVATRGDAAHGILATSNEGSIAVTTGDVSTGAVAADGAAIGGAAAHAVHTESSATGSSASTAIDTTGGAITTRGNDAIGIFAASAASAIEIESGMISTAGVGAVGIAANAVGGTITIDSTAGSIMTLGTEAAGISAQTDGAVAIASGNVSTNGAGAAALVAISRSDAVTVDAAGAVEAAGQSSPGIVAVSRTSTADVTVAGGVGVRGGWNVTPGALDANDLTGAGVILAGASGTREQAALLDNSGSIGAASDLAIASADHHGGLAAAPGGGVRIENWGTITGYLSLGSGTNVFNNYSSNSYNLRHFADTNGDGAPDTERVAIADFGGPGALFDNAATGVVRLSSVIGASTVDAGGAYVPAGLDASFHDVIMEGVEQGHLVNLASFRNAGVITMQDVETGGTAPVPGDILVITGSSAAGVAGSGRYISDGGQLRLDVMLNEGGANSRSDVLVVDGTQVAGGGATRVFAANAGGLGDWTAGDGIKIVDVLNPAASAAEAFVLGERVAAGAFEYLLFQGGHDAAGDPQDGDWYLRNSRPPSPDPDPEPDPGPEPEPDPDPEPPAPNYRVEVPLYSVLSTAAQQIGWSMLGTMHQRRGENFAPHAASRSVAAPAPPAAPAPQPEPPPVREQPAAQAENAAPARQIGRTSIWCKDPEQQFRCLVTPEQEQIYADVASDAPISSAAVESEPTLVQEAAPAPPAAASDETLAAVHSNAVWARTFGESGDHDAGERIALQPLNAADALLEGPKYEYDISGFQIGVDLYRSEYPQTYGALDYLGVYAGASKLDGRVEHLYGGGAGSMSMDGKSVGAYWTHFGARGWYMDAVVQGTRYDHVDARSTGGQRLETHGQGWSASLEAGYPFAIGARGQWRLEPQAQLIYQDVSLDEQADAFAVVDFGTSQALLGRLGARLVRAVALDDSVQPRGASVWLQANVWHTLDEKGRTEFATLDGASTIAFRSELGSVAQVGLGASIEFTRTAVVYATLNYSHAVSGGNSDAFGGALGIRWVW